MKYIRPEEERTSVTIDQNPKDGIIFLLSVFTLKYFRLLKHPKYRWPKFRSESF